MKNKVLGDKYDLSLVFIGSDLSKKLNKTHRGKNAPTDILSFPLTKNSGEIFIDTSTAAKEAKQFNRKTENFIGFLFIHGLVHLKGLDHGSTMEEAEEKIRRIFGI